MPYILHVTTWSRHHCHAERERHAITARYADVTPTLCHAVDEEAYKKSIRYARALRYARVALSCHDARHYGALIEIVTARCDDDGRLLRASAAAFDIAGAKRYVTPAMRRRCLRYEHVTLMLRYVAQERDGAVDIMMMNDHQYTTISRITTSSHISALFSRLHEQVRHADYCCRYAAFSGADGALLLLSMITLPPLFAAFRHTP